MQERDPLALGPDPWRLIDEPDPRRTAPVHHLVQVVHCKADVVNSGSALVQEPADRVVACFRLQELDKGLSGLESGYPGSIGIVERHLRHAEDVAIKIDAFVDRPYRDSDVRNPGSAWAWWVH